MPTRNKIDNYKYICILGKGHFSTVTKRQSVIDGKFFAVKQVEIKNLDPYQKKSIIREVTTMSSTNCENIVKIFDAFEENNFYYIIMEYINGVNLADFISNYERKKTPIDEKTIIFLSEQILTAMNHFHKKGIIHRDIKPDNILLTKNMKVKITDFGLAAFHDKEEWMTASKIGTLLDNASRIGPCDYVSPEIIKNVKYDKKNDIFTFGVTMFQMTTFKLPFITYMSNDGKEISNRVKTNVEINENIYSKELKNLIYKLFDDNPENRPTAQEALDELKKIKMKDLMKEINLSTFNCVCFILYDVLPIKLFFLDEKFSKGEIKKLENNNKTIFANDLKYIFYLMDQVEKGEINRDDFFLYFLPKATEKISKLNNQQISPIDIIQQSFSILLTDLEVIDFKNNIFQNNNEISKFPIKRFSHIYEKIIDFQENYKNIFAKTFYFLELNNVFVCSSCNSYISANCEIQNFITFEITSEIKTNITNLFNEYAKQNDTKNNKRCEDCSNESNNLSFSKKFLNTPLYLIIYLDNLLNASIEIEEQINIESHTVTNIGPKNYFLYAVINKEDINNREHYIAYNKNIQRNKWFRLNDDVKEQCSYLNIYDKGAPIIVVYQGF